MSSDRQSATGNDVRSMSDDFEHVLSAIDETNLAETIALQEAIIQSQMQPTVTSAAAVTTSPSQSHATVTQSLTTSAANDGRSLPVYSFRPHLTTSSVEIPEQERRLEAWLSLGSYEDVLDSNFHYWEIKKQLGDNGMEMTRIWRLHTPELRQRFDHEIETVQKSRPQGFNVNVMDLYHGTTSPLDQICAEGLDPRISVHGHFGRGMYFSDNPDMCRAFCESEQTSARLTHDERFVIRCQVILGDVKVYRDGESAPDLTREPEMGNTGGRKMYYHSVQNYLAEYEYAYYSDRIEYE